MISTTLDVYISDQEKSTDDLEKDGLLRVIRSLMKEGKGAYYHAFYEACFQLRWNWEKVESIISDMMDRGEIYEPEVGVLKVSEVSQ